MFNPHMVFVIGAGASSEFGLPLGGGLAQSIIKNLTVNDQSPYDRHYTDRHAEALLRARFKDDQATLNQVFNAGALITQGILHAQSIDAFVDMHSDKPAVATLGKLQIALEILRAEQQSTLAVDRSNMHNRIDFSRGENASSWLRVFTEILLEKGRATDLASIGSDVTLVCFNYDRCIEHYLIEAIEATLAVPYEAAHEAVYRMNIIHPYGHLGKLPSKRGGRDGVEFGADTRHGGIDIWKIADGLSTFTEEMRDKDQVNKIHSAIRTARRVIFLGFGFQSQNVQLLTPPPPYRTDRVAGAITTAVGFDQVAERELRGRMRRILSGATYDKEQEAIMLGTGCGDVMRHNRLALSAG